MSDGQTRRKGDCLEFALAVCIIFAPVLLLVGSASLSLSLYLLSSLLGSLLGWIDSSILCVSSVLNELSPA